MLGWLLLVGSAVLLVAGAELFVENATGAARRLGVTVIAVGILLAGAEPEELLTAVIAALRERPGLAAGDAIGANVTMLTACLGLAAVIRPLPLGRRVREYAALAALASALAWLALATGGVSRVEGVLLVVAYVVLVGLVWWREKEPPALGELAELDEDESPSSTPALALLLAAAGIGLMLVGGNLAVNGAERVVDSFGRADSAIGLTVLALATTAELFALVLTAMRRDVPEIAVAGVVGSAVYNATLTLGAAAAIHPVPPAGLVRAALAATAVAVVVVLAGTRGHLGRLTGGLLIATYAAYVWLVLA